MGQFITSGVLLCAIFLSAANGLSAQGGILTADSENETFDFNFIGNVSPIHLPSSEQHLDSGIEAVSAIEPALYGSYEPGDLVISEFFYRTPISWRTAEFDRPQYVEIYNRSDKLLNLRDYTINGSNIRSDADLPIQPEGYLVLARGVSVFESRFDDVHDLRNFVEAESFPRLILTTSSPVIVATNEGVTVDSLVYIASQWGGNEVALERYDFDVPAYYRDNWAESEDVLFGSPGLKNTIVTPTSLPEVVSAAFPSPFVLQLTFSGTLSDTSVETLSSYSLNGGVIIESVNRVEGNARTMEIHLDRRLEDQTDYLFSYTAIDDIFGNEATGDFNFTFQNPFRILSAEVDGTNDLVIRLTLAARAESCNSSDFRLSDGIGASNFLCDKDNSEVIRLTFDSPFETGRYQIIVNGLESFVPDLPEPWLLETDASAEFFQFDEYQSGDLVLNELMYRPPPGYPKYVEIKNVSDRFLTLKGFELRREVGASSNGGAVSEMDAPIEPNGFAVITEDSDLLQSVFGVGSWIEMNGFPGFTVTIPDQIRFLDPEENLIETVHYNPSTWGGNGVSLERRSTDAVANSVNNWGESEADLLGTPGLENTVQPHNQAPLLLYAEFTSDKTIRVTFSGSPDQDQVDLSNFSINQGRTIESVRFASGQVIELTLSDAMDSGIIYKVTTLNISDIFGNTLDRAETDFTYYFVQEAEPGDVLITEFMYNEPESYSEYIELYNNSQKVIDLAGWQQANDTGTRRVIAQNQWFLTPGSYIAIGRDISLLDFFPDISFIEAGSNLSALKNGGDDIVIANAQNVTIDSLRYTSAWGGNGVSLERKDVAATSVSQGNWAESLDPRFGTPGTPNTVSADDDGPELLSAAFIDDRSVEVIFSGAIDRSVISTDNFSITGGRSLQQLVFTSNNRAVLTLNESMTSGTQYSLTVREIPDIFGNILNRDQTEFIYYNIEVAEPGDVVINEFMYRPPEEYTRYIELYNRSDKAVDLSGWKQANDTATRRVLTTDRVILPPGEYMVLLPNFNLLSKFPDITAIHAGTAFAALKSGGDNIVITNAEDVVIDSLTYQPSWGGDGVSLERRRAGFSSLYAENWDESPNEKFGTPGQANEVERNFELLVTRIEALNHENVEIEFNVPIREEEVSAGNFMSHDIHPQHALLVDETVVRLHFSSPLPTGSRTMKIQNIGSLGGFEIAGNYEIPFTVFDRYEEGDILVNEFMYRPPDTHPRYIELYNRSDKLLNLKGWRLQRRQVGGETDRFIATEDLEIGPESYLVITDDMAAFNNIYPDRNVIELSPYPAFTVTAADQIRVFASDNVLADSLAYTPSGWGGNGVALERLMLDLPSDLRANWEESPNILLGTPGLPNDVRPDPSPPQIVSTVQFENLGFRLVFDKQLDEESVLNRENYQMDPGLRISMVGMDEDGILLFAEDTLVSGQLYTINVKGIKDLFGNEMEPAVVQIRYLEFGTVQPGDLVINEILYRRRGPGEPEFIEIYNQTEINADLSGWLLSDEAGSAILPGGTAIRANDYLVFTDEPSFAGTSENIVYLSGFQPLGNSGDAVVLKNLYGTVIDSVYYKPDWGNHVAGISLERKDPSALSIDPGNWAPNSDEKGSTPAEKNSRFEIDIHPPDIQFANLFHPDSLEVIFDSFIDLQTNRVTKELQNAIGPVSSHLEQRNTTRFLLNGIETEILMYNPLQANRMILSPAGVRNGEEISLTAENLVDFQGNRSASLSHPVAHPLQAGDLVINEIMFNPIADSHDGLQDQSEYIEIYNRMPYAISLEGVFLHNTPDEKGAITRLDPVSSLTRWIPAHGYALFYPEPDAIGFESSRTAQFFYLSDDFEPFAMQMMRNTLSLPNSGREVYLADSTGTVIDNVNYSDTWHNPNIIDTRGISLERINPALDSDNALNWGSHTSPRGGSPGSENSLYQPSAVALADVGMSVSPNPFSPDDDGFEDHLMIHYKLEEPGYLLKVRIYDRYGRLVRRLQDGIPAGLEETVIWDGRNDEGVKNRIGIYIVIAEAYNSTTGNNHTFRQAVVIARQF